MRMPTFRDWLMNWSMDWLMDWWWSQMRFMDWTAIEGFRNSECQPDEIDWTIDSDWMKARMLLRKPVRTSQMIFFLNASQNAIDSAIEPLSEGFRDTHTHLDPKASPLVSFQCHATANRRAWWILFSGAKWVAPKDLISNKGSFLCEYEALTPFGEIRGLLWK